MTPHMIRRAGLLGALTLLGACSDSSGPGSGLPESAALVSASTVRPLGGSGAALADGQAYVSMLPGTAEEGLTVDVGNLTNGASASSYMHNGGFDPIAVQAEAGDSLAVTITFAGGTQETGYAVVPRSSRPRIVRTTPARGKTDVPLNSVIVVVFNEPMDSASLQSSVRLRRDGVNLPGSLTAEGDGSAILRSRFVPDNPLALLTVYELMVLGGAQSEAGVLFDRPISVRFTTQALNGTARLRVIHAATDVGDMDVLVDGDEVVSDIPFLGNSGYLTLSMGRHDVWYQVSAGVMDQSRRTFASGADYTVLPCCAAFPLGGFLLEDDNSAPPAGQARLRVIDYATMSNSVRIYLTAPGADLNSVEPITINVLDATAYLTIPAGDYQVRFTAFDSDSVALDSGTLTFAAGQVRTMVAVDAAGGGPPYSFLVLQDRN